MVFLILSFFFGFSPGAHAQIHSIPQWRQEVIQFLQNYARPESLLDPLYEGESLRVAQFLTPLMESSPNTYREQLRWLGEIGNAGQRANSAALPDFWIVLHQVWQDRCTEIARSQTSDDIRWSPAVGGILFGYFFRSLLLLTPIARSAHLALATEIATAAYAGHGVFETLSSRPRVIEGCRASPLTQVPSRLTSAPPPALPLLLGNDAVRLAPFVSAFAGVSIASRIAVWAMRARFATFPSLPFFVLTTAGFIGAERATSELTIAHIERDLSRFFRQTTRLLGQLNPIETQLALARAEWVFLQQMRLDIDGGIELDRTPLTEQSLARAQLRYLQTPQGQQLQQELNLQRKIQARVRSPIAYQRDPEMVRIERQLRDWFHREPTPEDWETRLVALEQTWANRWRPESWAVERTGRLGNARWYLDQWPAQKLWFAAWMRQAPHSSARAQSPLFQQSLQLRRTIAGRWIEGLQSSQLGGLR